MKWSLILLSIFGLVTASPIGSKNIEEALLKAEISRNSLFESHLRDLLESLRTTMLNGSGSIPVLDPLKVNHLAVDENVVPVPGLYAEFADTTVSKLATFEIDELTLQRTTLLPLRYRLDFNLAVPVLEVDAGHYEIVAPVEGLTIFGKGDAKINIIEPRISGYAIVRPSIGIGTLYIQIQECEIKFSLKDFDPHFNGLLGGDPAMGEFLNSFLRFFVTDLVKLYEAEITIYLSSLALQLGNEYLSDLNLISIIGSGASSTNNHH